MSRANRIKTAFAGLLIVGVVFAVLPKDWIEETFNVDPDAGSGVLELAFVLVPIAIGLLLLANVYVSHRHQRVRASGRYRALSAGAATATSNHPDGHRACV